MEEKITQKNSLPRQFGKIILTLENCLLSDNKLQETPSQQDGLDKETETNLRILGCELIQIAGILLKLPQVNQNIQLIIRIIFLLKYLFLARYIVYSIYINFRSRWLLDKYYFNDFIIRSHISVITWKQQQ